MGWHTPLGNKSALTDGRTDWNLDALEIQQAIGEGGAMMSTREGLVMLPKADWDQACQTVHRLNEENDRLKRRVEMLKGTVRAYRRRGEREDEVMKAARDLAEVIRELDRPVEDD